MITIRNDGTKVLTIFERDIPSLIVPASNGFAISNTQLMFTGNLTSQNSFNNHEKKSLWTIFKNKINKFITKKEKFDDPVKTFTLILDNRENLQTLQSKKEAYIRLLEDAKRNNQVALAEKIERENVVKMKEEQLILMGFPTYISEKNLVSFAIKCEKGLRLDYLKNFTRVIPKEVSDKLRKSMEYKLFTNYTILHYDPEGKSTEMTAEEVRKARDPILFGIVEGSRKLYFIGDWKDEMCNLTLEEIAKIMDEDPSQKLISIE